MGNVIKYICVFPQGDTRKFYVWVLIAVAIVYRTAKSKNKKVLQMATDLSRKEGFAPYFIYAQSQFAYESVPSENYLFVTEQKLAPFRSMNIDPLIVSEDIKQKARASEISDNVIGVRELSRELIVLDDPSGYGGQHMNEAGNRLFAETVFDTYLR